jgi:hypothetical protein
MTIASGPASDFTATLTGESPFALCRIYLLRAGYLLTAGGMGPQMWSTCASRLSRERTRDRSSHPLLCGSRAPQGVGTSRTQTRLFAAPSARPKAGRRSEMSRFTNANDAYSKKQSRRRTERERSSGARSLALP